MTQTTVSVDTCLSRQAFDACQKPGQKVWWIKKKGANKFVNIGRNNKADRPLNISAEFPEPGAYIVGCGPDAKEGGIRVEITVSEPAAKVEAKVTAAASAKTTVPEPVKVSAPEPAGAEGRPSTTQAESLKEIAATLRGIEDGILKTLSDLGQERDSVGGTKPHTRDDTVRGRHRTLDLLNRCINTDISYQQHLLCRIEEARHAEDESPEDIALLFAWRATQSLAAARRIVG